MSKNKRCLVTKLLSVDDRKCTVKDMVNKK